MDAASSSQLFISWSWFFQISWIIKYLTMIGYFTRTGTLTTLGVLRQARWRPLLTPDANCLPPGFDGYALDNGVWGAAQRSEAWDSLRFVRLLERYGDRADWVVLPDVVAGGMESLERSLAWLMKVRDIAKLVLIPAQDGMAPEDLESHIGPEVGIFLGGSTHWKLSTAHRWGALCQKRGAYFHIGRVNSHKRMTLCRVVGANSFDGTSVSRYTASAIRMTQDLEKIERQIYLW